MKVQVPTSKIALGCGTRVYPGFFHVDLTAHPHVDLVSDVRKLDALEDQCATLVYACHVLEHVARAEVISTLIEWRRVLKPHGIVRISVPNFAMWVQHYLRHGNLDEVVGSIIGGQKDEHDFHRSLFDAPTLTDNLKSAGFNKPRLWDWREVEHSGVDDFSQAYKPDFDKEHGMRMSLNMEATKP